MNRRFYVLLLHGLSSFNFNTGKVVRLLQRRVDMGHEGI
jgi:hypothetical protein